MTKIFITTFVALTLTACAQIGIVRSAIDLKGAAAADQLLVDAEFVICRGVTVGSWVRRYGRDPALAGAWQILCGSEPLTNVPLPLAQRP